MEEKDVQRLLDMLYGMIDEAKSAAFSSEKCIINRDEALDLLDEVKESRVRFRAASQEQMQAQKEQINQKPSALEQSAEETDTSTE